MAIAKSTQMMRGKGWRMGFIFPFVCFAGCISPFIFLDIAAASTRATIMDARRYSIKPMIASVSFVSLICSAAMFCCSISSAIFAFRAAASCSAFLAASSACSFSLFIFSCFSRCSVITLSRYNCPTSFVRTKDDVHESISFSAVVCSISGNVAISFNAAYWMSPPVSNAA